MKSSSAFDNVFWRISARRGLPHRYYPKQVITEWKEIVDELRKYGYSDDASEYDNDISIRDGIESILMCDEPRAYDEFTDFQKEIQTIDNALRDLFLPNVQQQLPKSQWWYTGILTNGRGYYASYFKRVYGITLEGYTDKYDD